MGNLAGFLVGLATPLVKRVLIALGIGIVTYGGVTIAFDTVKDHVVSSLGGITGDVGSLIGLSGSFEAIGIILGAMAARVAVISLGKMGRVL